MVNEKLYKVLINGDKLIIETNFHTLANIQLFNKMPEERINQYIGKIIGDDIQGKFDNA